MLRHPACLEPRRGSAPSIAPDTVPELPCPCWDVSAHPGSLVRCFTIHSVKRFFFLSNLNFPVAV